MQMQDSWPHPLPLILDNAKTTGDRVRRFRNSVKTMIANNNQYDVAILGGGLAGLTLAKQLLMQDSAIRIAVIEKRSFPVNEAAHKVGESTVEIGAHYFGEVLKLKKHLTDQQLPKFGLRFFFKDSDPVSYTHLTLPTKA